VRIAVEHGVSLEDALVLATMNPAEYHNFHHLGQLAPGYKADVLAFDSFAHVAPARVWQRGRLVAADGAVVDDAVPGSAAPDWMLHSVHLAARPAAAELDLAPPPGGRARVIGIFEAMITTEHLVVDVTDPEIDVARIGVLERHLGTGRIGLGRVSGFGLERGAMASTVAHDAHNCMVVGARDGSGPEEMAVAVARLAEIGGGQVAVLDGRVIAEVPLPIGGLMSPLAARDVADLTENAKAVVHRALGVSIEAPFMHLSFLGLSVIPHLRLTDKGLVDVDAFALTDVAAP
jgi:adenine deaminase